MIPKTAQYFMPMNDGVTPQLYYRIEPIKYNDGTIENQLQYKSTCGGGWFNSSLKDNEKSKLVKIN